jgi:hypothetical protein
LNQDAFYGRMQGTNITAAGFFNQDAFYG